MDEPQQSTQENVATVSVDTSQTIDPLQEEESALRDSLKQLYKDELYKTYQIQANRLTSLYILAQQKFYSSEFEEALALINRAANIKQTPDVLAMKGSIYLGLGSLENFIAFWKQALSLDKNVPIPPSPAIVAELNRQGLINDNFERNF